MPSLNDRILQRMSAKLGSLNADLSILQARFDLLRDVANPTVVAHLESAQAGVVESDDGVRECTLSEETVREVLEILGAVRALAVV